MIKSRIVVVACLMSLALGCGRENSAPSSITLTNTVDVVREVVTTNTVTVTVTNVVTVKRVEEMSLSARRTSPYVVSSDTLDPVRLRKLLSDAGARVISCAAGSVACIEAREKSLETLRTGGVVSVRPIPPQEKVAPDVGEDVSIVPLSSIDAAAVAQAVKDLGGQLVQVVTVGRARIRAKLPLAVVRKLAERGDILKIERDAP